MDTRFKQQPVADRRQELAEERTFLAWIRTGIALLGFGFVVAHFGISADGPHIAQHGVASHEASLWFGTLIIAVGVVVHLISAWRYVRLAGELRHASVLRRHLSEQGVVVALVLALLGIALAIYMILVHGEPAGGAMRA